MANAEAESRLGRQIRFILELDKLKSVARRTYLIDRSRNENTAEHSWHVALMAALLAEHADEPVDACRVTRMLLVHDVVEIDAGDTYCYDAAANLDKGARERSAADRLFGLLPADQAKEFRGLWEEFEACASADSRFANALDRLQPMLNNYHTQGQAWREHGISADRVEGRMAPIADASAALAEHVRALIADAVAKGLLIGGK